MMRPLVAPADVSIIVPTLNEAGNLPTLLQRIDATLSGRPYEVLLIDDGSTDSTFEVVGRLRRRYPVHLHVRRNPNNGLSGAVLYGLARARGDYLVVMDADLQHPPERIPDLLSPLQSHEAEFVLGSRYVPGGSTDGRWGAVRQLNSRVATLLARPFAGGIRDPMSGFFALRRETYERASDLNPVGYKIALELICKCGVRRPLEVPIHFALRIAGDSKLNLRQQVRYLDHLSRLYDYCFPRASPWAKFVTVTACGWLVAFSVYVRLVARDVSPLLAPTLAFAAAAGMTALFHRRAIRARGIRGRRVWIDFTLVILGEWSVCTLAARWVALHVLHLSVVQIFLLTFGAAAVARYTLRTRFLRDLRGVRAEAGTSIRSTSLRKAA